MVKTVENKTANNEGRLYAFNYFRRCVKLVITLGLNNLVRTNSNLSQNTLYLQTFNYSCIRRWRNVPKLKALFLSFSRLFTVLFPFLCNKYNLRSHFESCKVFAVSLYAYLPRKTSGVQEIKLKAKADLIFLSI